VASPLCVLLLPRTLEEFILRDQAEDLLRAPGVVAVEPARLPYGAVARLPGAVADGIAGVQARRLVKRLPGTVRAVVIFHPIQYALARAMVARVPDAELWYGRWDRYEAAYDASPARRERLRVAHELAAQRSALTFAASVELQRLEREQDRDAVLVPLAADSFPALPAWDTGTPVAEDDDEIVAVSLGHLGWRTDWALLRAAVDALPELRLLLVGAWHEDESGADPDFRALRAADRVEWLGRLDDEQAAGVIRRADVGIVPFRDEPFNQAGLPYRILKYARQGRRTVSPELAGAHTWEEAVTFAADPAAFVAALRAHRGARARPDHELRQWALEQTAWRQNAPLWDRLEELGIASR
jgi:hypothetical protein